MLSQVKNFLKEQKADFFLLPNSDQFFSEYLPENEKRIEYLTGFTGSNAVLVIGQKKSYFFTDGRYILQANNQLDSSEFEIFNIASKSVLQWLEENLFEKKLALDAKLSNVNFVKSLQKITNNLLFLEENLVDKFWQNRPKIVKNKIFELSEKICGESSISKRERVLENLDADAILISNPQNLCWLLNVRSSDVEFSPLLLAYGILFKNGEVDLFVDEARICDLELKKVNFFQPNSLESYFEILSKKIQKIQIDPASLNYWLWQILERRNFEIIYKKDQIELLKSQKNLVEIEGAIMAHQADGKALTKFLNWVKTAQDIDEIKVSEKLLEFRKEDKNFLYPSFATIAGFASNGAIIHYHANEKTNKKIAGNSLLLIDSGGQYFGDFIGTTDVTRTIAIGKPSAEMIENFTRVLKGHIDLARAKFPRGTTGAQLDVLARFHLWQAGLDYDHGTGHGVGAFLSVHEGPCGVSRRAHQELLEGMIISNEPGFYKEGEYGIRIENLMLVEKFDEKFLCFKTLTLAPIDMDLVDMKMLTYPEKKWLEKFGI